MNCFVLNFLGPQEIVTVILAMGVVFFFLILLLITRYLIGKNRSTKMAKELENQFNKYQDATFTQKDIRDYFPVKEGNKITLIQFEDIVDFSASNNFIFLTDTTGKDYLVDSNLADLESKLPKDFIRVHKSTIVNSKLISEVKKLANGRYDLVMKCEKERIIPCSKNYNDKIKSIIDFN